MTYNPEDENAPVNKDLQVVLTANHPVMQVIEQVLSAGTPNWKDILVEAKQSKAHMVKPASDPSTIFEVYVGIVLKELAKINDALQVDPIKSGTRAGGYIFESRPKDATSGTLTAQNLATRKDTAEYDRLLLIYNNEGSRMLAAVEAKMASEHTATKDSDNMPPGILPAVLNPSHINRVFTPLQAYATANPDLNITNFGYVVVTTSDVPSVDAIPNASTFTEVHHGIVVRTPVTTTTINLQALLLKNTSRR